MKSHIELRERLDKILLHRPTTIVELCKDMQLNHKTVYSFLSGNRKSSTRTLFVVENYLIRKEKEYFGS